MNRIKRLVFITLLFVTYYAESHTTRSLTIINSDKNKDIFLYYDNALMERQRYTLQALKSITIKFDSLTPEPLVVYVPVTIARLALCMPMMAGDTLRIGYDKANDMYTFHGPHTAEYKHLVTLEALSIAPNPMTYMTHTLQKKITYKKHFGNCQAVFKKIDSVNAIIRKDSLVRPEIKKLIDTEFKLIKVSFLAFPGDPGRTNLIDHPEKVPQFYRDSLAKYARIFERLGPQAMSHSRQIIFSLTTYIQFLTLAGGKPVTISNTFEQACNTLHGAQRDVTCFFMLKTAQRDNVPMQNELARFQTMLTPNSPYLRILLKHYELSNYPILKDTTFQDLVVNTHGDTLKLRDVLASMKDSLVYVDVWASWCAPCIMGMPHSQALTKKYSTRKFKVIYISIDAAPDKWKEAEAKYLPETENSYRLLDHNQAMFYKKFKIDSIPRYLLVDTNTVVRQHKALSPDHPELPNIIEPLMKDRLPE